MARMTTVDEYVARCTPVQKERLVPLLDYMRGTYPDWEERLSYQMPMFKHGKQYVAFSVAAKHLSLHSLDFETIASAKELFPTATFGKGCVKIPYTEPDPLERLHGLCDQIVARTHSPE